MNKNTSLLNHLKRQIKHGSGFEGGFDTFFLLWNTGNLNSQASTSGYLVSGDCSYELAAN
jgi:hypothetical protein